ncbi:energy-coupling factor transporter transmembrane protein EcfT [Oscillospiraceae bacterium HV4-5-C5C]|nr:energy-coupling factor transporter transmembrane protein EcfT [Oscillospiraceae bacterium HV4-5-C5C]
MRQLNPSLKALSLLLLTLLLAALRQPWLNLSVFALCGLLMLLSGVRPRALLLTVLPLLILGAGLFFSGYRFAADSALRQVAAPGAASPVLPFKNSLLSQADASRVSNGLVLASRVFGFAGPGLLLALTTDRVRLVRSLGQSLRLPPLFTYGLLAAWGMFSQMNLEYARARAAFRARGIRVTPLSLRLLRPLLIKSVRWSEALAIAMESKGFEGHARRSSWRTVPIRLSDWLFLGLCLLPAIGFFI